jgi:hypothetical protein
VSNMTRVGWRPWAQWGRTFLVWTRSRPGSFVGMTSFGVRLEDGTRARLSYMWCGWLGAVALLPLPPGGP